MKTYSFQIEDKTGNRYWLEIESRSEWEARQGAQAIATQRQHRLIEIDLENDF